MRTAPRPRHAVSQGTAHLLSPFFRYSVGRDAYVLRVVGNRLGPVLVTPTEHAPAPPTRPAPRE